MEINDYQLHYLALNMGCTSYCLKFFLSIWQIVLLPEILMVLLIEESITLSIDCRKNTDKQLKDQ